jgi:hypothetical protein
MLVLIATNELQGTARSDYSFTVEGELVTPLATECARGEQCGCRRGFPGLASARATTTAMVVERPGITEHDLRDAVYDWLDRGGWIDLLEENERVGDDADHDDLIDAWTVQTIVEGMIDEHVEMIAQVCAGFPVGTVVVRHGSLVAARSFPRAA